MKSTKKSPIGEEQIRERLKVYHSQIDGITPIWISCRWDPLRRRDCGILTHVFSINPVAFQWSAAPSAVGFDKPQPTAAIFHGQWSSTKTWFTS
eukprot:s2709_g9.t1